MPTRTPTAAFLAFACFLCSHEILAAPALNFLVNSQVPPVARISQQFSFTFAESTFFVSEEPIFYSLLKEPSWLQFDNSTRTFFGNVTGVEAGPTTFELVASDSSGSSSHEVTFVVTDQGGPQPGKPILPQLGKVGPTSAPSSLLLYPLQLFSIAFSPDTFSNTTKETTFYATSADNSPLPSWLHFDAVTLGFSGTSPSLVSPAAKPQLYGVRLIASDIDGFAEAIATFQIVVGYQILAFSQTSQTIELSQGQPFESKPFRNLLTLDGKTIDDTEITKVTCNAPNWAHLNTDLISLSGTPPQGASSQSVLIEVADIHGNMARTIINLVVSSSQMKLFSTSRATVNATVGQDFRYMIDPKSISSNAVQVTADLSNASSWLTYDATSMTFSGSVPDTLQPGPILITLHALLGPTTEHEEFVVDIIESSATTQSAHTSSNPSVYTSRGSPSSSDQSNANTDATSNHEVKDHNRTIVIVLGILLPLLLLLCLIFLGWYCCQRRRKHRQPLREASELCISRPVMSSESERTAAQHLEGIPQSEEVPTPTSPPRIELPWAPDALKKSRESFSRNMSNRESTLVGSGWGDLVIRDAPLPGKGSKRLEPTTECATVDSGDWTPFVRLHSNSYLNYSRKRTPFRPTQGKMQRRSLSSRASKTFSGLSNLSIGLPTRLSGAGHGAGGPGPAGFADVRRSWRNTVESFTSENGKTTPFDLDAFPDPPRDLKESQEVQQKLRAKASVRMVPSSSSSQSGSLVDQRQKWVKDRARDRLERGARFSNALSSKPHPRVKDLDSNRSSSRVHIGSFDTDDLLRRQNTWRSWSRSSSIGVPARPVTRMKSSDSHLVRHPSNMRTALSTVSGGRFDSADSKSNSSWIDDLIEEEDKDGRRRWVAVDNLHQEATEVAQPGQEDGGDSEQGSWGKNSRTGGLGALRANIQSGGQVIPSGERKWRLGGQQAKRPVSVDEGELQRTQGSQKGNLAFV